VKNVIKTRSKLAKFIMTVSFLSLGCTAIGVEALAQQAKAAGARAEQSTTKWSVTYPVGYSDLDVSKLKGARILYLRIRHAAEVLCESAATWGKKEGEACVRKAVDDAVARVGVPLLSRQSAAVSWQRSARNY
jgi:UrcA family protein